MDRSLAWHPLSCAEARAGLNAAADWFLPSFVPESVRFGLMLVCLASVIVALVFMMRAPAETKADARTRAAARLVFGFAAFIIFYLALLTVSISLFDAATEFGDRMLSVLYVPAVLVALYVSDRAGARWRSRRAFRIVGLATIMAFLALGTVRSARLVTRLHREPRSLGARAWRESPILAGLVSFSPNATLYANDIRPVFLYTGRKGYSLPLKTNRHTLQPNAEFQATLAECHRRMRADGGYVVFLDRAQRNDMVAPEELAARFPLRVVLQAADGRVYAPAPRAVADKDP